MAPKFVINRFRIVHLSDELQKEFDLPEKICADPEGLPFPEGQAFHAWLIDDNACQRATANNYLKSVLQFLTYLWFGSPSILYTASAELIRNRIRDYLREKLGCAMRPHRNGNLLVLAPKIVTKTSVRLYLIALKRFYTCAILNGWYTDVNPLVWTQRLAMQASEFTPTMPPHSGMTLPTEKRGRVPETYFCVSAGDWKPHIIDDPEIPKHLVVALIHHRDQLITRILFESGARVGEVLGLTVGDWRSRDLRDRALTSNKGSRGERVKEIWWSSGTSRRLHRYVNEERRQYDPLRRGVDELPDPAPLFVTNEGDPYNYPAFYYHWRKACDKAGVRVHPHQARHWFVTMALRSIQALPDEEKRRAACQSLIAYMSWKNPETIKAYDHHLHLADFSSTHTALTQLIQFGSTGAFTANTNKVIPPLEGSEIPQTMWDRLSQLLDGEEESDGTHQV